ncbi:MAG: 16S rRNA (uracil(1498)-N(3))-methyltransferase [Mariprofundus sp.]|nr:16S rRNA (uracil(1498)-N(3))-methyltransferase [Mariprofundus sp.]
MRASWAIETKGQELATIGQFKSNLPPMLCRLYLNQELISGTRIPLPHDQAHYLRNVMRLTAEEPLVLFNGKGGEFHCRIEQLTRQHSTCLIESFSDINREMPCRVHIVQAACRSEKIEIVLQKATELGAASFQIVRSERSSLKLDGAKLMKRMQRWQKIIIEASEQSGRTAVPEVHWRHRLADIDQRGLCFTLHPGTNARWQQQRDNIAPALDITLAIGPEGGWNTSDLDRLTQNSFQSLSFGPRIMRTETAAPALLAAIQSISRN